MLPYGSAQNLVALSAKAPFWHLSRLSKSAGGVGWRGQHFENCKEEWAKGQPISHKLSDMPIGTKIWGPLPYVSAKLVKYEDSECDK